jgi:hypothetical protein
VILPQPKTHDSRTGGRTWRVATSPLTELCAWCNRMQEAGGEWISDLGDIAPDEATWTICPDCLASHYRDKVLL